MAVKTSASRQRLHAARRKNGLCVRRVVIHEVRTLEVLIATGFLADDDPTPQEFDDALARWTFAMLTRQESRLWPPL